MPGQGIISTLNPVVGSFLRSLARSGADIVTIGAAVTAADVAAAAAAAAAVAVVKVCAIDGSRRKDSGGRSVAVVHSPGAQSPNQASLLQSLKHVSRIIRYCWDVL